MVTISRNAVESAVSMESEADDMTPSDPAAYIAPLKRRWWLLIIVPLLLAFGAYELTSLRPSSYSATATLLVNPLGSLSGNPTDDIAAATQLTKTYSEFVTSPTILQQVVTDLKLMETPTQLASLITVTAEPSSQLIRVATKYPNAQGAADITNAVADRFILYLPDLQRVGTSQGSQILRVSIDKARSDRDAVTAQLAALRPTSGTTLTPEENARIANLDSLRQQYDSTYTGLLGLQQRLSLSQFTTQNGVSIALRAVPPQGPTGSLRLLATAAALLIGFGATVAGVVLVEQANPRVRSRKDLWRVTELPVLATVPRARHTDRIEVVHEPRSAVSETIYTIQTQIGLVARGNDATTIMITSPGPEEGASFIAANLAVAFAQARERVVLVDGDLRHPSLWQLFKKDAKHPGLAELAAVPSLAPRDVLISEIHGDLQLLLAGPVSTIPTERLMSERLERIVADLRDRAEIVIIVAPPLLTDSDALLFAVEADHTVVVARAGQTRIDGLRTTLARLRSVRAQTLGIVLCDVDGDGSAA